MLSNVLSSFVLSAKVAEIPGAVQAQIKENIKAPCHLPLWGESTGDRWFLLTKGQ